MLLCWHNLSSTLPYHILYPAIAPSNMCYEEVEWVQHHLDFCPKQVSSFGKQLAKVIYFRGGHYHIFGLVILLIFSGHQLAIPGACCCTLI